MATFMIDKDNGITAVDSAAEAAVVPEARVFGSEKEFMRLAAEWPAERLVDIWNGIPGVKPVIRFTSRNTGVRRIWKAIQPLAQNAEATSSAPAGQARRKSLKPGKAIGKQDKRSAKPASREGSKTTAVLALLQRKGGCTLAEIMQATGWQAHSVRGFISGAVGKKMGLSVASIKNDHGERTYSIGR